MSFTPENFTVWVEIPVSNLDRAISYYNTVFDIDLKKDETGPNPMAIFPTANPSGAGGHLYEGKPGAEGCGPTIYLACPDKLEDAVERVKDAGGRVVSDVITIPAGRFAYCLDPDGNSVSLFSY